MKKYICVYSSSSCAVDKLFFDTAHNLGEEMAKKGYDLVFGAGVVGLMGETARALHENNGKVIGVIPKALNKKGIVYESCDELIVTEDMRERKKNMELRASAFIALPGGFGTLEELLEIITLKQLKYHNKPIIILNVDGFYNGLIDVFENIIKMKFAKKECRDLYFVTDNVSEALHYIDNYKPHDIETKWMTDVEKER